MSLVVKRKRPDGTVEEMDAERLWEERDRLMRERDKALADWDAADQEWKALCDDAEQDAARLADVCARWLEHQESDEDREVELQARLDNFRDDLRAALAAHDARVKGGAP